MQFLPNATAPITLPANAATLTPPAAVNLTQTVGGYTVQATAPAQMAQPANPLLITLTSSGGGSDFITPPVTLTGLPTDANLTIIYTGGGTVAELLITPSADTPPGLYSLAIGCTVNGNVFAFTVPLTVAQQSGLTLIPIATSFEGFSLTCSDSQPIIQPGTVYTIKVTAQAPNGAPTFLNLAVTGLPAGVTAAVSLNSSNATSTITFTVAADATPGTYTYGIDAIIANNLQINPGPIHTYPLGLTLDSVDALAESTTPLFTINVSPNIQSTANPGTLSGTITFTRASGYSGTPTPSITGATDAFTVNLTATGYPLVWDFTIAAIATAPLTIASVTFAGADGASVASQSMTLYALALGEGYASDPALEYRAITGIIVSPQMTLGPTWPPPQTVTPGGGVTLTTDAYAFTITQGDTININIYEEGFTAWTGYGPLEISEQAPITWTYGSSEPNTLWCIFPLNATSQTYTPSPGAPSLIDTAQLNTSLLTPPGLYAFTIFDHNYTPNPSATLYVQILSAGSQAATTSGTALSGTLATPASAPVPTAAGVVAATWRGIQVLRARIKPTNPSSPPQMLARSKHLTITTAQKVQPENQAAAWAAAALQWPGHNPIPPAIIDGVALTGGLLPMTPKQFQYMCQQCQQNFGFAVPLLPTVNQLALTYSTAQPTTAVGPYTLTMPSSGGTGVTGYPLDVLGGLTPQTGTPLPLTATLSGADAANFVMLFGLFDLYDAELVLWPTPATAPGTYNLTVNLNYNGAIIPWPITVTVSGNTGPTPVTTSAIAWEGGDLSSTYGTLTVTAWRAPTASQPPGPPPLPSTPQPGQIQLVVNAGNTALPAGPLAVTVENLPAGVTAAWSATGTPSTNLVESNPPTTGQTVTLYVASGTTPGSYSPTLNFTFNGTPESIALPITITTIAAAPVFPTPWFPTPKSMSSYTVYDHSYDVQGFTLDVSLLPGYTTYGSWAASGIALPSVIVAATSASESSKNAKSGSGFAIIGYYLQPPSPAQFLADWQAIYGPMPSKGTIYLSVQAADPFSGVTGPVATGSASYQQGTLKSFQTPPAGAQGYDGATWWCGPYFAIANTLLPINLCPNDSNTQTLTVEGIPALGGNGWTAGDPYGGTVTLTFKAKKHYPAVPGGVGFVPSPAAIVIPSGDTSPIPTALTISADSTLTTALTIVEIEASDGLNLATLKATINFWGNTPPAGPVTISPTGTPTTLAAGHSITPTYTLSNSGNTPQTIALTAPDGGGVFTCTLSTPSITVPAAVGETPGTATFTMTVENVSSAAAQFLALYVYGNNAACSFSAVVGVTTT